MTQWVENPELGRERGPVGLLRAWIEVLVHPRQFFHSKVAPGDQAPGLTFAAAVVLAAETSRLVLGGGYPVFGGETLLSGILWVLFVTVLIAPAGIHLTAALQTVILMATVDDRAGVSETVQVICYALAPCVLAGVPNVWVQAVAVLWGAGLLVVGMASVHDVGLSTALPVVAVPALLVFGYGFGGNATILAVLERVSAAVVTRVG